MHGAELSNDATFVSSRGDRIALRTPSIAEWTDPRSGQLERWFLPAEDVKLPDGLVGRVVLGATANVVEVPSSSLVRGSDETMVFVLEEGVPKAVPIEVLRDSGTSALVQGELTVGDDVAEDASWIAKDEATGGAP
ncbi:MAG: hypothetical protein HC923_08300 [Myxococcales bacterium]|nr:hypothetical protein [Myxococcales bacterium]